MKVIFLNRHSHIKAAISLPNSVINEHDIKLCNTVEFKMSIYRLIMVSIISYILQISSLNFLIFQLAVCMLQFCFSYRNITITVPKGLVKKTVWLAERTMRSKSMKLFYCNTLNERIIVFQSYSLQEC